MNRELLSYIVAGAILIGGGVPLVALFIRTVREIRKLDKAERGRKEGR